MKNQFIAAAALTAVCCSVAVCGNAQEVQKEDSVRVYTMETIEIRATRAGSKTPVAHTNVDKTHIESINFGQDIPYLLSLTPSVVATSDAGTGIGYTGIRIRGVDPSRINVTSNGIPMNDPESHTVFWVNIPDIASSVEDIQVQRGIGTSTNGAGAFGGSINLKTESFSREPSAEVSGSYGSYNTHKEVIKVNTGLIGGKWAFGARLSNLQSDGYIDRAFSDLKSYFAQAGYFSKNTVVKLITFGGKEKTYHAWDGLQIHGEDKAAYEKYGRTFNPCGMMTGWKRDANGNPVLDGDGKRIKDTLGFYDNQTDNYIQTHYQAIVNQKLTNDLSLNVTLHATTGDGYYEEYKNKRSLEEYGLTPFVAANTDIVDYADGAGNVTKSNLIRRKQMKNIFGGGVASLSYTGVKLNATLGGAANVYDGSHFGRVIWVKDYTGNLDPSHEYYRNYTTKTDANVFLKADYEVINGLNIYADLQYRYIRHKINGTNDNWDYNESEMQKLTVDNTYNFFNPKAGVFYDIDKHNNVYASFAMAHKEPTRNNFTDAKANSSPKPERLLDYELGYTFRSKSVSAGVNLYYMDYKDQLVLTGENNEIGEPLSDNVAKSYRTGIELSAGWQIAKWIRWDVNATFSRNRILDYSEYIDDYDSDWNALYTQTRNNIGETTIAYSPSIIAGSLITVKFGDFTGVLQSQFVDKQYVTNSMQKDLMLDAYFVNNIRLEYEFRFKGVKSLTVGVALNNIFNQEYYSNGWGYSALIHDGLGDTERANSMGYFPQAKFNVLGNVTIKF